MILGIGILLRHATFDLKLIYLDCNFLGGIRGNLAAALLCGFESVATLCVQCVYKRGSVARGHLVDPLVGLTF